MSTRTVHDPFLSKDVQISDRLVDRLRGKYACGPVMKNGEPEFGWRQHEAPPIQHEAADRIEALEAALMTEWAARDNRIEALEARIEALEAALRDISICRYPYAANIAQTALAPQSLTSNGGPRHDAGMIRGGRGRRE